MIFRAVLKMKIPSYTQTIHLTTLSIRLRSVQCNGLENGGGAKPPMVPLPQSVPTWYIRFTQILMWVDNLTWAMFSTVCYSLHCSTARLLTFPVCWMESGPGIHSTLKSYFVIFQGMWILWLFLPNWTNNIMWWSDINIRAAWYIDSTWDWFFSIWTLSLCPGPNQEFFIVFTMHKFAGMIE